MLGLMAYLIWLRLRSGSLLQQAPERILGFSVEIRLTSGRVGCKVSRVSSNANGALTR